MDSELSKVMEAISSSLPSSKPRPTTKPKLHSCRLFIRNQGASGTNVKAFICLECGHKTFSLEDLPVFRSNYPFNTDETEVSLEPYWAFMDLQLQEASMKLKKDRQKPPKCKICEFQASYRMVNYQ